MIYRKALRVGNLRRMKMVDKIVLLLEARGWDQDELESMAGLAHGRISKWKADKGEPTARQALRIARLLNVSMEYLADDELAEPTPVPAITLADDERAILELYRDLELDKREAVKRLATPLVYSGEAWLPGSVRDLTPGERARYRQARRAGPEPEDEEDLGDPALGNPPKFTQDHPPKQRRKGG